MPRSPRSACATIFCVSFSASPVSAKIRCHVFSASASVRERCELDPPFAATLRRRRGTGAFRLRRGRCWFLHRSCSGLFPLCNRCQPDQRCQFLCRQGRKPDGRGAPPRDCRCAPQRGALYDGGGRDDETHPDDPRRRCPARGRCCGPWRHWMRRKAYRSLAANRP